MGIKITFEEFKENFMEHFDGFIPTYAVADEEFFEDGLISINIEMIAPWRMTDGPSKFFKVFTIDVNKAQFKEIKDYMIRAGKHWMKEMKKHNKSMLSYSNKFKS